MSNYRYEEDYTVLRDANLRHGAHPFSFAPLKYVPLSGDGENYLSFGGEFRLRHEFYDDNTWGQGPQDGGGYLWGRALPYADLHLGPNFRAFAQLIAAFEWDDDAGVSPPDEDRLDLLQAFVDVKIPLGDDAAAVLVRPGRQLLRYGSERLIGLRYGPNVLQPFDAALARFERGRWRLDAFYARPVEIDPGEWDDQADDAQSAWSLYATRDLPGLGAGAGVDAYYIGYLDREAAFAQGGGRELRHTLGTRFFGERNHFDWDVEGFYQFGSFDADDGDGDVSAWSVASSVGYTLDAAPFRPRLGLRANVISGDDDPDDRDLQTFNALFPKGKYFGEIGLLGPYNLINVHPTLTLALTDKLALDLTSDFYWRYSTDDGIYDNAGNVVRAGFETRERFIGTQLDAVLSYAVSRELEASAAYSVFLPGRFIEETGPDEVVHFVGLEFVYKF